MSVVSVDSKATSTGGRSAAMRHIPPRLALAVGAPSAAPPPGWKWWPLSELARLESGHTPSRRHPEYWGGSIPWVSIRDAKAGHGKILQRTDEQTNDLGILNSSARVLPAETVCLSRTASVGYVTVLGQPMATSQDFVNWVCGSALQPDFLKYLLLAEGKDLLRFASGSVHQTIYFPEAKAFHVCIPERSEQQRVVAILDKAFEGIATAKTNAEKNLQNVRDLFTHHREAALAAKEGWREAPLADLCTIKHGYAFEGEFFSAVGDHVLLTPGSFFETGGYRERGEKTKYFTGEIPSDYVLAEGDLLVAMTEQAAGLLGSPLLVPASKRFLHNQRLGLVVGQAGVPWSNDFFFHVFNLMRVRREIHASASGAKVRHTSPGKMGLLCVAYPDTVDEQRRIAGELVDLSEECGRLEDIYERKLSSLEELKKSLLHRAFSAQL